MESTLQGLKFKHVRISTQFLINSSFGGVPPHTIRIFYGFLCLPGLPCFGCLCTILPTSAAEPYKIPLPVKLTVDGDMPVPGHYLSRARMQYEYGATGVAYLMMNSRLYVFRKETFVVYLL